MSEDDFCQYLSEGNDFIVCVTTESFTVDGYHQWQPAESSNYVWAVANGRIKRLKSGCGYSSDEIEIRNMELTSGRNPISLLIPIKDIIVSIIFDRKPYLKMFYHNDYFKARKGARAVRFEVRKEKLAFFNESPTPQKNGQSDRPRPNFGTGFGGIHSWPSIKHSWIKS